MVRMTVLCLAAGMLAQVLPQGCLPEPTEEPVDTERRPILISASAPESAQCNETVTLTATAVGDLDGGEIAYSWLQTSGPGVQILNANEAEAAFVAPSLASDAVLAFAVVTTNERGDFGRADVSVLIQADPDYGAQPEPGVAGAPVARAGPDREITEALPVTLDGSNSRGDSLTYEWTQIPAATVELEGADTVKATFTAPAFVAGGINELEFKLTVRDRRGRSSHDTVLLKVMEGTGAEPKPHVRLTTSKGEIVLELDRTKAPISVDNFLRYVRDGFYNGTIIHRVDSDVIQGGGFRPGLRPKEGTRDPIVNEADNGLKNLKYTIAMARTSDPDSATSQFYINLEDNPEYDARPGQVGYAVFGKVISGKDVVDAIGAVATEARGEFATVPIFDVVVERAERIASD